MTQEYSLDYKKFSDLPIRETLVLAVKSLIFPPFIIFYLNIIASNHGAKIPTCLSSWAVLGHSKRSSLPYGPSYP
jgi:hypothetical protein